MKPDLLKLLILTMTIAQLQQEKATQLLYTADVKLGHLRMMKKAVQKEPPNIPSLLNVQLRD